MASGPYPCTGKTEIWFPDADPDDGDGDRDDAPARAQERARSEAIAREGCMTCPVARRAECAKTALLNNDKYGVWAGVALPGGQPRKRSELEEAQERLRLIAGLDRCPACWSWFVVAAPDPAVMAAAISAEVLPVHRYERMCPSCAAGAATTVAADEESGSGGEVVDLPPSGDAPIRRYWELRGHDREAHAGDWLLIAPDGVVEGRYAWSLAMRTFGRSVERFRRMVAAGWTARPATSGDWAWNHQTVSA